MGIDRSLPVSIEVFGWRNAIALPRLLRVADHGDLGHSFAEYKSQGAEAHLHALAFQIVPGGSSGQGVGCSLYTYQPYSVCYMPL